MEIIHGLLKLGIKVAIWVAVLYLGSTYLLTAIPNHCWNPMGCVPPVDHMAPRPVCKGRDAWSMECPHS